MWVDVQVGAGLVNLRFDSGPVLHEKAFFAASCG